MTYTVESYLVHIPADGLELEGELILPENCAAVVAFAHGSGSSRHSPRNKFVAEQLNQLSIGTLLFDLLSEQEDKMYETRFNIDLLMERLIAGTKWLQTNTETKDLKIGYFGASTGAAAALNAAADNEDIFAVVSRGGRPDLATKHALHSMKAPTLLIVGGNDFQVITLNQMAYDQMHHAKEKELAIIDDATHLFEEPGTLEEVARLAGEWFTQHFS